MASEVQALRSTAVTPPSSEQMAMIHLLDRILHDPSISMDRIERMVQLQKEMKAEAARVAFATAFVPMQQALPVIAERGKITIRSKNDDRRIIQSTSYALWEDINDQIKPKLAEFGFGLSFLTENSATHVTVTAVLSHDAGHERKTSLTLPYDATGSKNSVQSIGSSTSYGKRYTAIALLNLTSRGEDDDGAAGGGTVKVDEGQVEELRRLLIDTKTNLASLYKLAGIEKLEDLTVEQYEEMKTRLELKTQKKGSDDDK